MYGGLRRNPSSDVMSASQVSMPAIGTTFQETPHNRVRTKEIRKYLRKICYHRIKCTAVTFLAAFMWIRSLNSATSAITTHKKLERVSDGMGTQVRAQMINKCRMKMIYREIYNMRDLF